MWWIIPIAIIILAALWGISTYNNLISSREFVRNSMGNIAAQVESRWDAVKSLIDAAKKYSSHEVETLTNITAMRAKVDRTSEPTTIEKDDNLFEQAMNQINVVAETIIAANSFSLSKLSANIEVMVDAGMAVIIITE